MAERVKDMTKGRPAGLIIGFALPLMLGNVFQQLYTMVDAIVVGKGVGVEALAALGAADWPNWLVTGLVIGFTQGFSIRISQHFGAEDWEGLRKTVAMSVILTAGIAVIFTALSLSLSRFVLVQLDTPANVFSNSLLYLRIIFGGIPIILGYNVLSAILRALGDSRTPLSAMVIAACINIVLDLVFVMVFHWGVAGAAIATVFAQFCSCVFCFFAVRRISFLKMEKKDWRIDWRKIWDLVKLGSPTAFQNGVIGVGGLAVQYVINGFGFLYVAGFTATNKLYGILEIAASSFGYSMTTFVGQNLGAGKRERIRSGMRVGLLMAVGTAAAIAVLMLLFGRFVLMLFISGDPSETEQVLDIAYHYLSIMCCLLPVLYLLWMYRSALMGMGDTVVPMLSGMAELAMRMFMVLVMTRLWGVNAVYWAESAAWTGAAILLAAVYYIRLRRLFHPAGQEEKLPGA
ncbi:MAG TPA: MATE family efflux transporter [Candidatus Merdivicinus intestinavium]|nr:MATE family efflux transporter [Candidatus Merdivicinus intestinavium]